MPDAYEKLAPYYDLLGMSAVAEALTPNVIGFAQTNDWVGRRIIDLGCGTGASTRWLVKQGYNIIGIDSSPSMLAVARSTIAAQGVGLQWVDGDASTVATIHDLDIVIAFDIMNEFATLRDVEAAISHIAKALPAEKIFAFDLHTIEGMAADANKTVILQNDAAFMSVVESIYDHERQTLTENITLFDRQQVGWQRVITSHQLRGYPIQAVIALLHRAGFSMMGLLNLDFQPVSAVHPNAPRVICIATRNP